MLSDSSARPVAPTAAPFLILETGEPVPTMRRYGRFPHWIRVAAGLAERDIVVVNVAAGAALPDRPDFVGAIITGSAAFVTDRADWSERSADWLREAAHAGMPLLGICYGHQLLAHALGGEVAHNPAGRESGTVQIALSPQAAADPLFYGLPERFPVHATHVQTVLRVPAGATVLAHSAQDQCQALRWGEATWGLQFHPEFATHHIRGYVHARADCLRRAGRCARTIARDVTAAPLARRLLRRFVQHARDQY